LKSIRLQRATEMVGREMRATKGGPA